MLIRTGYDIVFEYSTPTPVLGMLYIHPSRTDAVRRAESLVVDPPVRIDDYIEKAGLDAPPADLPQLRNGYDAEVITELDLQSAGITSVIWATGYKFDFGLVRLPVLDANGFPIQKRGVTEYPGLYFVGMPWLYKAQSGLLFGVGDDADHIVADMAGKEQD